MLFTIITPTYNRAHMIERTINSVLQQSFTDWEYIIIDDGSTDNTEEIIQKYLEDKRFRYIKKENSGAAHSRNIAVSLAKGEFITFIDSDDDALPNWLEVVSGIIKPDTGIACTAAIRKLANGTEILEDLYEMNVFGKIEKVRFTCGSFFIRRSVFTGINGYDLSMPTGLQSELGYRAVKFLQTVNLKIVSTPEYLVQIYVHNGPRLRKNFNFLSKTCLVFINKNLDYFKEWNRSELSNNYTVIAFYNYKDKNRKAAIYYLAKGIRYRPFRISNYFRLFKYTFF